jgi:hypothetical protein
MWLYVYKQHLDKFDWFYISGDDQVNQETANS